MVGPHPVQWTKCRTQGKVKFNYSLHSTLTVPSIGCNCDYCRCNAADNYSANHITLLLPLLLLLYSCCESKNYLANTLHILFYTHLHYLYVFIICLFNFYFVCNMYQLHYDLDEMSLQEHGELSEQIHPFVSSVLYLDDGGSSGAATLVTNQVCK